MRAGPSGRDWSAGPGGHTMPRVLWTNGCILLMLWALGYVAGGAVGQWVHLLAVLALLHFVLALLKAGRHLPRSHGRWPEVPRPGLDARD